MGDSKLQVEIKRRLIVERDEARAEIERLKTKNASLGIQVGDTTSMALAWDALKISHDLLEAKIERLQSDLAAAVDTNLLATAEVERLNAFGVTTSAACETANWTLKSSQEKVAKLRNWMDNNFTYCEPGAVPVLGSVTKRIWYHATDDTESYPFSEVVHKVLDNG